MNTMFDVTAWSALILGLSALFAGVGALRKPGIWRTMIDEVEQSPALQFVCGMLELLVGTVIYLANPWLPGDVLACLAKGLGGLMMIEALAILGFCDIYTQFWLRTLSHMHRGWAASTVLLGLALSIAGAARFQ
ncbi:MAG: hypothetical protein RLZZ427_1104 [Pseudomonadota bacterium]|jgi:uncharacterized protein YjeT (DUF2065 family)